MASHRRTIAAAAATILTSISLYPVFIGTAWFWAGAGAVLAVAGAATLTRLRRLPVLVCVVGTLAGLLLYLNLVFSNGRSWGHLLPTATSLRLLWDLAGQGFHESSKYAPPVPALSGMVLLAAAGIGIIAVLTDLIAVRLGSAALAGLPLLLLFTEPFTLSISRDALGHHDRLLRRHGRLPLDAEQRGQGPDQGVGTQEPGSAADARHHRGRGRGTAGRRRLGGGRALRAADHPRAAHDPAVRQRPAGHRRARPRRRRRRRVPRPQHPDEQRAAHDADPAGVQLHQYRHQPAVLPGLRARQPDGLRGLEDIRAALRAGDGEPAATRRARPRDLGRAARSRG